MNLVVKVPNSLKGKLLTFPMLHILHKKLSKKLEEEESDKELNLHLLSTSDSIDVLNLLPFSAYYHQLEEDDISSVFSIHRACMNLNLTHHTDVFISTTDSFVDATIGKNIKAKKSIGFQIGKNNFFLNEKIPLLKGRHKSDQAFQLLYGLIEDPGEIPNVISREVEPLYPDWNMNPYFVVNINFVKDEVHPEWKELLDLFQNRKIIITSDQIDSPEREEGFKKFLKSLDQRNVYKYFNYSSNIEFAKLIAYAKTFISYESPLVHLASYCGAHVFYLNEKEDLTVTGTQYFLGEVRSFNLKEPQFTDGNVVNYAPIFDEIFAFLEDEAEEDTEDDS